MRRILITSTIVLLASTAAAHAEPSQATANMNNAPAPAPTDLMLAGDYMFQKQGNINYATGGIGVEELDLLAKASSNYNLKVLSVATNGAYLGEYRLRVSDAKSNETLLNVIADGPYIYAALPAGSYKLSLDYHGNTTSKTVTVPKTSQRETVFRLRNGN